MRDWTLGPGDPLHLTLAADFRLSTPDYANDHIWELEPGGGDPPALALHTTYGLRARTMRIFPRFTLGGQTISDPAAFALAPRLRRFHPSLLVLDFSPFANLDILAEYWIPESHAAAGRLTITNRRGEPVSLLLELCGQLVPLDGLSMAPSSLRLVNVLAGTTSDLAPVLFITGGPQAGPGPYPALSLDLALAAGGSRTLTWAQAALSNHLESFDLARRTAAAAWDAECARVEMVSAAQTVEVRTGDPDWDAAFAFTQKAAFGLFFPATERLPWPSFVHARQPDHGYSPRRDGSDHPHLWSGQSPLESYYLASSLPGAPELAEGLIRNFLAAQAEDGDVDWRPGLAGQRGRWLAAPLLASLAWETFERSGDLNFLREVQADLSAFGRAWFRPGRDRDGDGFPEWDHPVQTGFEDQPAFTIWQSHGQGADIQAAESPALAALLCREFASQARIADALTQPSVRELLELDAGRLRGLAEECWDAEDALYHLRDRDSHRSPAYRLLGKQRGPGKLDFKQVFRQPVRLLIRLDFKGEASRRPELFLTGTREAAPQQEHLVRIDFQWGAGTAAATSRCVYTSLEAVEIEGIEKRDLASVAVMDFSQEDVTCFLPLWAGVPNPRRARTIVSRTLFAAERFGRPYGIPACPSAPGQVGRRLPDPQTEAASHAVHLPWNLLICEGLLAYGFREEAAQLTARLMGAVIKNLRQQRAFYRAYHAETGAGIGERNALHGLAPLGLFLRTLGVEIRSPRRVALHGKNPFPWPVVVQYRGLKVARQAEQTLIAFPNGQSMTVDDPTEAVFSMD
jgi:hypothetical protein